MERDKRQWKGRGEGGSVGRGIREAPSVSEIDAAVDTRWTRRMTRQRGWVCHSAHIIPRSSSLSLIYYALWASRLLSRIYTKTTTLSGVRTAQELNRERVQKQSRHKYKHVSHGSRDRFITAASVSLWSKSLETEGKDAHEFSEYTCVSWVFCKYGQC